LANVPPSKSEFCNGRDIPTEGQVKLFYEVTTTLAESHQSLKIFRFNDGPDGNS